MPYLVDLTKSQKYLEWLKTKIYLDSNSEKAKTRKVRRGQIYWCHFGIGIGSEMSKRKARPCVILQNDIGNIKSPNTIVAPITHDKAMDSYLVPIISHSDISGKVILDGKINITNIVCVSKARLGDPIGNPIITLTKPEMDKIDLELAKNIDLIRYYNDIKKKFNNRIEYINKIKLERNKAQDIIKAIKEQFNSQIDDKDIVKNIQEILDNN